MRSLNHSLHHLRLDSRVPKVFAVEVLWFVCHSVSWVSYDWDFNFVVVWKTCLLFCRSWAHGYLETSWKCIVSIISSYISNRKPWSQRIDIEEWIFSMVDLSYRSSVNGLMTGVANRWQIHPSSFILDLNSLKPKFNALTTKNLLTRHHETQMRHANPWALQDRFRQLVFWNYWRWSHSFVRSKNVLVGWEQSLHRALHWLRRLKFLQRTFHTSFQEQFSERILHILVHAELWCSRWVLRANYRLLPNGYRKWAPCFRCLRLVDSNKGLSVRTGAYLQPPPRHNWKVCNQSWWWCDWCPLRCSRRRRFFLGRVPCSLASIVCCTRLR